MGKFLRVALTSFFLVAIAGVASAQTPSCRQDINNDGKVDRNDMKIIDDAMGSKEGKAPYDERADLNRDGWVNADDRKAYARCTPLARTPGSQTQN